MADEAKPATETVPEYLAAISAEGAKRDEVQTMLPYFAKVRPEDLRALLATIAALTRERDEARRNRFPNGMPLILVAVDALPVDQRNNVFREMQRYFCLACGAAKPDVTRSCDCGGPEAERDALRARLATAERVVDAAREMLGLKQSTTIVRIGERPAALRAAISAHDAQATPRTEAAEQPRREPAHVGCVSAQTNTCAWLKDGTKLILRRDDSGRRAWMEQAPQAVISAAAPTPTTEEKKR